MLRLPLARISSTLAAFSLLSAGTLAAHAEELHVLSFGPQEDPIAAAAFLITAQGTTYADVIVTSFVGTDAANFVPALEAEFPPNLVLLDLSVGSPDGAWEEALGAYIQGGGCAIATVRTAADAAAIAPLFDAVAGAEHDALPVRNWILEPLWQSFVEISSLQPVIDNVVEPNGVLLDAAPGGVAHAGFVADPTPGQAAIVVGNSGRTILHGFLPSDLSPSDPEADGDDMLELGQNEVFAVGAAGCGPTTSVLEVPTLSGTGLGAMALLLAAAALIARRRALRRA